MDVTTEKCACTDCVCVVEPKGAIEKEGRVYCSEACANHHKDGAGCHHANCTCHG